MSKNERLVVLSFLLVILSLLFIFPLTRPNTIWDQNAILFSSLFLLSFSALLLEHFFSRPTDVLAAAVSILLLLIPSAGSLSIWGNWYYVFLGYEIVIAILAVSALLLLTDNKSQGALQNRLARFLKSVATNYGSGKIQYFWLFFLSLIFFVPPRSPEFVALLLYAALVFFLNPQKQLFKLPSLRGSAPTSIGIVLGVQGRRTFLIRLLPSSQRPLVAEGDLVEFEHETEGGVGRCRALLVERFILDDDQWVRAISHKRIDLLTDSLAPLSNCTINEVHKRSDRHLRDYLKSLVGLVHSGTAIGTLKFLQLGKAEVSEGDLVQVDGSDSPVLYQVVNANVSTENLESKNEADHVIGEGIQLGKWVASRGAFDRYGWVPHARSPVVKVGNLEGGEVGKNEMNLGNIPGTSVPVILNKDQAISHHMAILGVTGVGKSVFARNFVRELVEDDIKVIVVDFTREWKPKMSAFDSESIISPEKELKLQKAINEYEMERSKFKNQQDLGVIRKNKKILFDGFKEVLEEFLKGQSRIRIFELPDVSNTEGALEYTQWFFKTLFFIARESDCFGKRVCIVLEEAHTVIPEWNFIGLADKSSQSLVNNISQIALQGRKYGVGFVVIAQRTATVSKSVLTQCNTVVAFQCFDGTSIEFLSHYLPQPMADTLPNLRFRRAIAVGKAIRGSVPLMFDVPDIAD